MPRPRTVLLPPIMQVLQAGQHQHFYTEGVSNVIKWVDIDTIQLSPPYKKATRPKTPLSDLMKTIDLRDGDPSKDGEEHFSYVVCFPNDDTVKDDKDSDTQKTLTSPLRGSPQELIPVSFWKNNVITGLTNAAKVVIPPKSNFKRVQY